jgi:hypothetical protein
MHVEGILPDRVRGRRPRPAAAFAAAALLIAVAEVCGSGRGGVTTGVAWAGATGKPLPDVVAGVPAVKGAVEVAAVQKTLKKGVPGLKPCFAAELAANPTAAGVGHLTVRLDDHGEVMASTLLGPVVASKDAPLAACVKGKVAVWRVPGVKVMGTAFKVPLTFGAAAALRKGPARAAAETRTVADALPPAGSIEPPPPPATGAATGSSAGDGGAGKSGAAAPAPEGYVMPAEVAGGEEAGWVFDAVEATADPTTDGGASGTGAAGATATPAAHTAHVEIVNVRAGAGLDKAAVEAAVGGHLTELEACWTKALAEDISLTGGQLILSMHVVATKGKKVGAGRVFSAAAVSREIGEAALRCIEPSASGWTLPAPVGPPKAVVTATFKFTVE